MKSILNLFLLLSLIFIIPISRVFDEDNPSGDFYTIVISDTHISSDESKDARLKKLIEKINSDELPKVELLLITGDLVASVYGSDKPNVADESENRIRKLQKILNNLKIPYYLILGNHDYRFNKSGDSDMHFSFEEIQQMEQIWKKDASLEPYYAFDHQGWKFICLNSMRGRYLHRHFDDEQLDWFEKQLNDSTPAILLFHHPVKTDNFKIWCKAKDLITPEKEPRFFFIMEKHKKQIKGIFVGHGHRWVKDRLFNTIKAYEADAFGESKKLPFYLVGFDNKTFSIHVSRIKANK